MKYINQLKLLLILFLTSTGFVYAQAMDSSAVIKPTHPPKKKCCYLRIRSSQEVNINPVFYRDEDLDFMIECKPGEPVTRIWQYGDDTGKTQSPPVPTKFASKKIYKLKCVKYGLFCGYADWDADPSRYNFMSCH